MSSRTHTSSWRQAFAHAPAVGTVIIVGVFLQGNPEVFVTRWVYFVFVPLCLVGLWCAWRLAQVISGTPVTPIAQARAGYVALRGKAESMPNQPPLTTPDGTTCVWYYYRSHSSGTGSSSATDSTQPFLIVDKSGKCIVLPDGANITGGTGAGTSERLIRPGDKLYVAGELRPLSADTLEQIRDVEPDQTSTVSVVFTSEDGPKAGNWEHGMEMLKKAKAERAAVSSARAAANRAAPLGLPVVCAPSNHSPFMIYVNDDGSDEGGWYKLLTRVNLVLLLGSGAMLSYLLLAGR